MYNERKDRFSVKELLIQLLFIILFVFILIWLFPTKGSINKGNDTSTNNKFDVLTNRIFNENLQTMKEAAISYYTTSRLPKNVNDSESMTLRKMLDEKLLIEFKDANNKSCDLDDSYVEITKYEDEYILKVNLSCTDNDAYILVHLGCYDYCLTDVCENKDIEPSKPIENPPKQPDPTPTPDPIPEKVCTHKFQKVVTNSVWSNWSDWSTTAVEKTSTKDVQTKVESTTKKEEVLTGYNKVTTKTPITKDVQVQVDTIETKYCAKYGAQYTETNEKRYEWVDQGVDYYNVHPKDDATTKYEYVGSTPSDCGNCINKILYIYRKYTLKVYDVVVKEDDVCLSYGTYSTPIFVTLPQVIGYDEKVTETPVYEMQDVVINTTYYRFRTLTTTTNTLTEWSSNKQDQNLINQGYNYVASVCK